MQWDQKPGLGHRELIFASRSGIGFEASYKPFLSLEIKSVMLGLWRLEFQS
jgi:hypothetical protein